MRGCLKSFAAVIRVVTQRSSPPLIHAVFIPLVRRLHKITKITASSPSLCFTHTSQSSCFVPRGRAGLPVTLRMLRCKSEKSDWFWSQSVVFTHKAIQNRNLVGPRQRSRFLVLSKRSAVSGDENDFRGGVGGGGRGGGGVASPLISSKKIHKIIIGKYLQIPLKLYI